MIDLVKFWFELFKKCDPILVIFLNSKKTSTCLPYLLEQIIWKFDTLDVHFLLRNFYDPVLSQRLKSWALGYRWFWFAQYRRLASQKHRYKNHKLISLSRTGAEIEWDLFMDRNKSRGLTCYGNYAQLLSVNCFTFQDETSKRIIVNIYHSFFKWPIFDCWSWKIAKDSAKGFLVSTVFIKENEDKS